MIFWSVVVFKISKKNSNIKKKFFEIKTNTVHLNMKICGFILNIDEINIFMIFWSDVVFKIQKKFPKIKKKFSDKRLQHSFRTSILVEFA